MGLSRISTILCLAMALTGTVVAVPRHRAAAAVPCSSGRVALTFDDGPKTTVTPRVVSLLKARRVPATFFVMGEKVQAHPSITRQVSALGFTIGNHTFGHERLTRLSAAEMRSTLRRTHEAIVAAGARPSALVRPSYGAVNQRVRDVIQDMGLVILLWTVDPRDWAGRSASSIVSSTLAQLKPGQLNIVLLHDGVKNSPETLRALPGIIRGARARGYCFVGLGASGTPAVPAVAAGVRVSDASVGERPGGSVLSATVSLDQASPRATSVRLRTVGGSATSGRDYLGVDRRVRFPAGATRQVVAVRVRNDLLDERAEQLGLRLSGAVGLRIKDGVGVATIRDDDPPPRLTVLDAQATEPSSGSVLVPVTLRLDRPSGKWVRVTVTTSPGSAGSADYLAATKRVTFAPGQVTAELTVSVLADTVEEGPETFLLRASEGANVTIADPTGQVTILPPSPTP